jgi:hypothetical protein
MSVTLYEKMRMSHLVKMVFILRSSCDYWSRLAFGSFFIKGTWARYRGRLMAVTTHVARTCWGMLLI